MNIIDNVENEKMIMKRLVILLFLIALFSICFFLFAIKVSSSILPYRYSIKDGYKLYNQSIERGHTVITLNDCDIFPAYRGNSNTAFVVFGRITIAVKEEKLEENYDAMIMHINPNDINRVLPETGGSISAGSMKMMEQAVQLINKNANRAYHIGSLYGIMPEEKELTVFLFDKNFKAAASYVEYEEYEHITIENRKITLSDETRSVLNNNISLVDFVLLALPLVSQSVVTILLIFMILALTRKTISEVKTEDNSTTKTAMIILYIVFYILINLFTYYLFKNTSGLSGTVFSISAYIGLYIYIMKKEDVTPEEVGFRVKGNRKDIIYAVIAALAQTLLINGFRPDAANVGMSAVIIQLIWYILFVGFPEELFFRGFIQTRLCRNYGATASIILSSMAMGLVHIPQRYILRGMGLGEAVFSALILVSVTSIPLAYFYHRTKNVCSVAVYHGLLDFFPKIM